MIQSISRRVLRHLRDSVAAYLLRCDSSTRSARSLAWLARVDVMPLEWVSIGDLPRSFPDAVVLPETGAICAKGRLYMQRPTVELCRVDQATGSLIAHSNSVGVVKRRRTCFHNRDVVVGDAVAPDNFYHFTFELLPKVLAAHFQYAGRAVVLPDTATRHPIQRQLIKGATHRPIVLRSDCHHRFLRATMLASPQQSALNLRAGESPRLEDYQYDPASIAQLRQHASVVAEGSPSQGAGARIFLARPDERRSYNQEELIAVAQEYGFSVVHPHLLSLADQLETFRRADLIVGPSGAAWVNLIHCAPGTQALSWLPKHFANFSAYTQLSRVVGVEMSIMCYPSLALASGVTSVSSYQIDPDEFHAHLSALVDEMVSDP